MACRKAVEEEFLYEVPMVQTWSWLLARSVNFMRQTNNPFFPLEANYGDAVLPESIMQQAGVSTVLKDLEHGTNLPSFLLQLYSRYYT